MNFVGFVYDILLAEYMAMMMLGSWCDERERERD